VRAIWGVTVVEEENVPETIDLQKTMGSMINLDGATLLFPTPFGYFDPQWLTVAPKFSDAGFEHAAGLWHDGMPANIGSHFGHIGMGRYLNGNVAGHMTTSKKIGFVAAKPSPQVLLNITSFLPGARAVDPTITCRVVFAGEWSLAVKEAEARNALCDAGCDVITCHVDGPKVTMQTAVGRGACICGYHANQSALAPDRYLTGAEWNRAGVHTDMAKKFTAGETILDVLRGGIADGFVKLSPLGPDVTAGAKAQFDSTLAQITKGGFAVIKGPLKDNKGNVVLAEGEAQVGTGMKLESMDYLVEGVIGSTG
jgi:simple sugar transport system substrate-binding protein